MTHPVINPDFVREQTKEYLRILRVQRHRAISHVAIAVAYFSVSLFMVWFYIGKSQDFWAALWGLYAVVGAIAVIIEGKRLDGVARERSKTKAFQKYFEETDDEERQLLAETMRRHTDRNLGIGPFSG